MPRILKWTDKDNRAAWRQGWNLFFSDKYGLEIERLDDPGSLEMKLDFTEPKFDGDESALNFVIAQAKAGEPLAAKALTILAQTNPLDKREANAQEFYEDFNFDIEVVGQDGWEWTSPGREWTRRVYLANTVDPNGPSVPATFVVVFATEDSSGVFSAHCSV